MSDTNNILSLLEGFTLDNPDDIARSMADDLRKRRIEKNITRDQLAEQSGVAVSNIVRFEQKGLISLRNLISLAMALGYTSELKNVFAQPKYSTMEELTQIRKNSNKKKAHKCNTKIKMNEQRCREIIDEVRSNCGDLLCEGII